MSNFSAFSDSKHDPFTLKGSGTKVAVLIHGFPGTPYEMRLIGEVLHQQGYDVFGLLLPGFGPDINNLSNMRREDWISEIVSTFSQFDSKYTRKILVGYSFGGALSINAVKDYNLDIDQLILFAPFWNVFGSYPLFIRLMGPIVWPIGRIFSPDFRVFDNINFDDPYQRKELQKTFEDADLDDPEVRKFIKNIKIPFVIIDELYKIGRDGKKKIKHLEQEILVLQGTLDEVVPVRSTDKLVEMGRADKIQYVKMDGLNHEFIKPDQDNRQVIEDYLLEFIGD